MSRSVQRRPIALSRLSSAKGLSSTRFDYWNISIGFCPHRGVFLCAHDNATIAVLGWLSKPDKDFPTGLYDSLASRIRLKGLSAARGKLLKPPAMTPFFRRASPA